MVLKVFLSNISILLFCMFILLGCGNESELLHQVTFQVTVKNPLEDQKVYITGNQPELGDWYPGKIFLDRINDSTFIKTISFKEGTDLEFKITAGNWWLEALDKNQNIYNNFQHEVENDTAIHIKVFDWKNSFVDGKLLLTENRFQPGRTILGIDDFWKYHPGDNLEWAKENFNDSDWITTDSYINFKTDTKSNLYINREKESNTTWKNRGWFRFHMYIDSSLWNKTLALFISQLGASEIYYNGRLLYSFGEIGNSAESFKPYQNRIWKEIKIDQKYKQLIAVRYANYNWKEQVNLGFDPGFIIFLRELNTAFSSLADGIKNNLIHQMVFTLVPVILFLLHIFLYSFYRRQRANLFYSFCMLGFAGITYFGFERFVSTNPSQIILFYQLNEISAPVTIFFGLLTAYSIIYNKFPKRWLLFLGICFLIILLGMYDPFSNITRAAVYIFFGLTMVDTALSSFIGKNKVHQKGNWIIFAGFISLGVFVSYQILIDYGIATSIVSNNQVFVYGMFGLAVSMSVFLSYNFAYINKDLEIQLANVKHLSEKTIEQERIANKLELERRIIEAENERKTKELEDARDLQLSLLPKEIPELKNLDVACYMNTATEVGGDYYDIIPVLNGDITLAIGDATGHGVKAGTMVAIVKGLIHELNYELTAAEVLEKINNVIRSMELGNLYMGLTLLKINGLCIDVSSAGMPPIFIYRKDEKQIEEIVIKRMPLGATNKMNFIQQKIKINPGDTILLLSDGLPELFNENRDMFDYKRVKEVFLKNVERTSEEIISELKNAADKWRNGFDQKDDMTFVVVKCKEIFAANN